MKKTISLCIIILILGLPFHATIQANQQSTEKTENSTIEVEIFTINKYENKEINLSPEKYQRLEQLLKKTDTEKNSSVSLEETYHQYKKMLSEITDILGFDTICMHQIQKSFRTIYIINEIMEKNDTKISKKKSTPNTNYFCYITGNTTNTTTFRIHNILPEPFLEWLTDRFFPTPPFPLPLWIVIMIMTTIYPVYLLSNFIIPKLSSVSPVNFMTVLTLGTTWAPSLGWIYTDGLNGIQQWDSPLYGRIGYEQRLYENLPAAYYPGIFGFSGIKINLGEVTGPFHLMHTHLFFGTAIMVSIENDD